jgi:hypothetical protein
MDFVRRFEALNAQVARLEAENERLTGQLERALDALGAATSALDQLAPAALGRPVTPLDLVEGGRR